jgi:hypothetical protein
LKELREIYVSKLAETEFSNPNYWSENLKVTNCFRHSRTYR